MSNIHPHDLHQAIRSWLMAEDPYGMNQRQEPTFPPIPSFGPAPPDTRASDYGQLAVAKAADRESAQQGAASAKRAATAGPAAIEKQLFGGQGARYSEAERDPRAQAWGEKAVERGTGPDVGSEAFQGSRSPAAQTQGESAVDRALNPPTGSGMGMWAPGEAADTASAVGEQAVAGALAKKARGKIAKGRLKDPVDEDDKSPE